MISKALFAILPFFIAAGQILAAPLPQTSSACSDLYSQIQADLQVCQGNTDTPACLCAIPNFASAAQGYLSCAGSTISSDVQQALTSLVSACAAAPSTTDPTKGGTTIPTGTSSGTCSAAGSAVASAVQACSTAADTTSCLCGTSGFAANAQDYYTCAGSTLDTTTQQALLTVIQACSGSAPSQAVPTATGAVLVTAVYPTPLPLTATDYQLIGADSQNTTLYHSQAVYYTNAQAQTSTGGVEEYVVLRPSEVLYGEFYSNDEVELIDCTIEANAALAQCVINEGSYVGTKVQYTATATYTVGYNTTVVTAYPPPTATVAVSSA